MVARFLGYVRFKLARMEWWASAPNMMMLRDQGVDKRTIQIINARWWSQRPKRKNFKPNVEPRVLRG
jgi:hypothetical protein